MIGIAAVAGFALINWVASQPSISPKRDIHQDQIRHFARGHRDAGGAVVRTTNLEAVTLQAPRQHVAVDLVVFDKKDLMHRRSPGIRCKSAESEIGDERRGDECIGLAPPGESAAARMVKRLPLPSSLSTRISPPISLQSFWLSASPSPVPPYLLVLEVVDDGEFLEQAWHLVRRDADAGIDDLDHELVACRSTLPLCNELDLAILGELHRVIEQLVRSCCGICRHRTAAVPRFGSSCR